MKRPSKRRPAQCIGVDGEGHDLPDGRHVYTYLAAVREDGRVWETRFAPEGLSHDECCELLLSLPKPDLKFGFSFGYDLTKILESLPYDGLYELFRPDLRREGFCDDDKGDGCGERWGLHEPEEHRRGDCDRKFIRDRARPVKHAGRWYAWSHGPFDLSDRALGRKTRRTVRVWDAFKFFQSSFSKALEHWDVGSPEERTRIAGMKAKRGKKTFGSPEQVKAYCRSECKLLATLMRRVIEACDEAELPLKDYYGAGSIASVLLKKHSVADFRGPNLEGLDQRYPGLAHAVLSAYTGGRSEAACIGSVSGPTYGKDINSAYPAAMVDLPCLACGTWRYVEATVPYVGMPLAECKRADLALCNFHVKSANASLRDRMGWAPLPFRDEKGSIAYPTGFRGWGWLQEVAPAIEGWGSLVSVEGAWLYETRCDHEPFAWVPDVYRKRLQLGASAAGIILKLGLNACYGKLAQHVGSDPPFQSWVWAGCITATSRGQILQAIASAKDPRNVLSVATDGIIAREELHPPMLHVTGFGTRDLKKPLGGWDATREPAGMFIAKPGVCWPTGAKSKEVEKFKARGLGRKEVAKEHAVLERAFAGWDRTHAHVPTLPVPSRRFYGAKTSVLSYCKCETCGKGWAGRPQEGCKNPECERYGRVPRTPARTALLHTAPCNACAKKTAKRARGGKLCACAGCTSVPPKLREKSWCGRCCRPALGQWAERVQWVTFDAHPKRERDTLTEGGTFARMRVRDVSAEGVLAVSRPYDGTPTPEGADSARAKDEALEQEDAGGE